MFWISWKRALRTFSVQVCARWVIRSLYSIFVYGEGGYFFKPVTFGLWDGLGLSCVLSENFLLLNGKSVFTYTVRQSDPVSIKQFICIIIHSLSSICAYSSSLYSFIHPLNHNLTNLLAVELTYWPTHFNIVNRTCSCTFRNDYPVTHTQSTPAPLTFIHSLSLHPFTFTFSLTHSHWLAHSLPCILSFPQPHMHTFICITPHSPLTLIHSWEMGEWECESERDVSLTRQPVAFVGVNECVDESMYAWVSEW